MIEIVKVLSECSNPALSTILPVVKNILTFIQIAGPIVLIISLIVKFTKSMMNPDEKKNLKNIINSVIAIFLLFFTPILINSVMQILGEDFTISECWNSIEENNNNNNNNNNNSNNNYNGNDNRERKKIINTNE